MSANLLVVDDDFVTRKMLRFVLGQQTGYSIWEAEDAAAAETLMAQRQFDLLIVDVMMPRVDGFALCQRVRRVSSVPIIIVSARGAIPDRVRGLQVGADDYLPKPFDPSELAARVQAVLRRSKRTPKLDGQQTLRVGDLTLHLGEHRVSVRHGKPALLTPTEFRVLLRLARTPGEPCTREQLMETLWGHCDRAVSATITTYISSLRQKIEPDPRQPRYVVTARGKGYRLEV